MPYRLDLRNPAAGAFDTVVDLGALDVETAPDGGLAALMPDGVTPDQVASALGTDSVTVSPAVGRDAGSVWVLSSRPRQVGRLRIVPAHHEVRTGELRLLDSAAFGTGLHATTALCLEALQDAIDGAPPARVLDVGTGSGVLALAALLLGVPDALGLDLEDDAVRAASANARLNGLDHRLDVRRGGPEVVTGRWPLVLANVLAAPLIEMAPALVQRIGRRGTLVLSGIPESVEPDVERAYGRLGMHRARVTSREGWVAIVMQATW